MAKVSNAAKPMPFPGESPTVALAMAAGEKYGLQEAQEKPARARPKRKAAAKKAAKPARKAKATKKAPAKKRR